MRMRAPGMSRAKKPLVPLLCTQLLVSENLNLQMTKNFGVNILISLCVHTLLAQKFPHVGFQGQILSNHSYVDLSLVGNDTSGSDSVQCVTDLHTCCSGPQGGHRGDLYFPNGTRLPFSGDVNESRGDKIVYLYRNNQYNVPGIYHCNILKKVANNDAESVGQIVYVGLYHSGGEQ